MNFLPILLISCFSCLGKATDCGGNNVRETIIVGKEGNVAFSTVQEAIDSVKINNDQWVKIHIKAGLYIESVAIPVNKPCILLEGEGSSITIITHWDHMSLNNNATFTSSPPNVIASGLTFKVNI
ncbi:putative pectinesterase 10 [Vigna unguiculata]|uniref:putative pectinesterase 10 n=1 Tax=Vigna unguiculata TaxID=3917 RepID=UPI001016C3B9|nr:putative pectinesterase 10 [Vigna unguiculata]